MKGLILICYYIFYLIDNRKNKLKDIFCILLPSFLFLCERSSQMTYFFLPIVFLILILIGLEDLKSHIIEDHYLIMLLGIGLLNVSINHKFYYMGISVGIMILLFLLSELMSDSFLGGGDIKLIGVCVLLFDLSILLEVIGNSLLLITLIALLFLLLSNNKKINRLTQIEYPFGFFFSISMIYVFLSKL